MTRRELKAEIRELKEEILELKEDVNEIRKMRDELVEDRDMWRERAEKMKQLDDIRAMVLQSEWLEAAGKALRIQTKLKGYGITTVSPFKLMEGSEE
jgi:uncharacterized coiled-coil DUF342 family protein